MKSVDEVIQELMDSTAYGYIGITAEEILENWKQEIEVEKDQEIVRITQLLEQHIWNSTEGSLSAREDYWIEYCKAHKIEQ